MRYTCRVKAGLQDSLHVRMTTQMYMAYLLGDCEVDEVGSNAHFWQVVRVGQLGSHVQLEVGIIVHIRAPKSDEAAVALAADTALQQWQQLGFQCATHFFHQERVAKADAGFQGAHEGGLTRLAHPEAHLALHALHPPASAHTVFFKHQSVNILIITLQQSHCIVQVQQSSAGLVLRGFSQTATAAVS